MIALRGAGRSLRHGGDGRGSADGKLEATSNAVWVREDADRRIYWGETHSHCGFGEGMGSAPRLELTAGS